LTLVNIPAKNFLQAGGCIIFTLFQLTPLGLIDEGDSVESAAVRELEEETGFKADSIQEVSDVIVSDPGPYTLHPSELKFIQLRSPGMTTANMKFVIVNVTMEDELDLPKQKLEEGEFIVPRVVKLSKLYEVLRGMSISSYLTSS